jgi:RNA polymerase sigma factor (sigma-70 family)
MKGKTGKYNNIHQELIDKCKDNDQESQFKIYKIYYKSMYNTSLRIVNDPLEAEDLMQESFLSAFRKIDTYKGNVSFGAWLRRIVINKSIDYLRRKKIKLAELNENHFEIKEKEPLNDFEYSDNMIKKIKEAMKKLPDGYRIVLSLCMIEGYDHREVGEILNINESTSRSQLARARKRLLYILKQ